MANLPCSHLALSSPVFVRHLLDIYKVARVSSGGHCDTCFERIADLPWPPHEGSGLWVFPLRKPWRRVWVISIGYILKEMQELL